MFENNLYCLYQGLKNNFLHTFNWSNVEKIFLNAMFYQKYVCVYKKLCKLFDVPNFLLIET